MMHKSRYRFRRDRYAARLRSYASVRNCHRLEFRAQFTDDAWKATFRTEAEAETAFDESFAKVNPLFANFEPGDQLVQSNSLDTAIGDVRLLSSDPVQLEMDYARIRNHIEGQWILEVPDDGTVEAVAETP